MLALLLLACTTAPEPATNHANTEPAAPAPVEAPAAAERHYVLASRLNLRSAPGGVRVGKLTINTPVEIVEEDGPNAKVRINNGKQGWVPRAFLADEPLTLAAAKASGQGAQDVETRLSWAQRAAALDVRDREALELLAQAYRDSGKPALATQVERQLRWPDDVLLVGAHNDRNHHLVVEWSWSFEDGPTTPEDVPEARMAKMGVPVSSEVWVLPTTSAAVQGTVVGMQHELFNECGSAFGYTLELDVTLPEGESAIAYTIKEPPKSWLVAGPQPDLEAAMAAVRAQLPTEMELTAAPIDAGVRVRAAVETGAGELDDMPVFHVIDFDVAPDGTVTQVAENDEYYSYIGTDYPAGGRDVDGDGHIELLLEGQCMMDLVDAEGSSLASTMTLCCGC